MILSDKIMILRRRNGWSQEELAERLDVSRQSVSKWEMGQSVPELDKIVQLSNLFGVSSDILIRDEIELSEPATQARQGSDSDPFAEESERKTAEEPVGNLLSEDDAKNLLRSARRKNLLTALGVAFCILSPILLIMQYLTAGLIALFVLVAAAVALFIAADHIWKGTPYSSYTRGDRLSADAAAFVREKEPAAARRFLIFDIAGVVLCILSVIPLLTMALRFDEKLTDRMAETCVAILLGMVACGVFLILLRGAELTVWGRFRAILDGKIPADIRDGEEPKEAREREEERRHPFHKIYWSFTTALYLAISFLTLRWDITWIIWPVAATLCGAIEAIWNFAHREKY